MKKNLNIAKHLFAALIILPALALFISCKNTSGYTISGEIDSDMFSIDSIFLYRPTDGTPFASAPVKDGKFTLKGNADKVVKAILGNSELGFGTNIILENGQQYEFSLKDGIVLLKGGILQEKVLGFVNSEAYRKAVEEYNKLGTELTQDYDGNDKARNEEIESILATAGDKVLQIENAHFANLIEGNEPTIVKLLALTETQDWENYSVEKRSELLNVYEKELGKHEVIDGYREYLSSEDDLMTAAENVGTGKPYINITAQTREKQSIELSNTIANNKYTLLEFWASWCGPCRSEIPHLKKAYDKYKAKGFEIYAISLDDNEADWLKAMDEEKTPWINVHNAEGFNGEVIKAYGIRGIPSSFLIDKDGTIVASMDELRGDSLDEILQSLLK
ncbi:MAG: TlpA disulfide reductase family protein [Bacteroidia bacterium]|nr:TlpA disulfide reductase family protein [Bacteroidia bacterium]